MSWRVPPKLKTIFTDTIWSIAGLVLMNVVAQFIVYPYWNRVLGSEAYGNIVYLIAIMNIMAISVGSGINYTRMRQSAEGETGNRTYLLLMAGGNVLSLLILFLLKAIGLLNISSANFALFCLLTVVTMWRFYADVEYRLHINYKGYFLYYLVIGIGYLLGILLFKETGLWPLTLLPGETAGLLLVFWKGSVFKADRIDNNSFSKILNLALLLVGTNLLSHLIFNGDRLILQWFVGSTAVTTYYIASLFGKTMTLITTPLNGVLVGHLARYNGKLTRELMNRVVAASFSAIIIATMVCVIAARLILPVLYPNDYQNAKQYLILANAAQIVFFVGNVLTASILLRFTHAKNQLVVNVAHGVLYTVLCIPLAWKVGIYGFCWGLLGVNAVRIVFCIILGYSGSKEAVS